MLERATHVSTFTSHKLNELLGLSEEMFEEGWTDIVNIDISLTVINQMNEHYKELTQITKNGYDKIINK